MYLVAQTMKLRLAANHRMPIKHVEISQVEIFLKKRMQLWLKK